jgi:hypothetical protein
VLPEFYERQSREQGAGSVSGQQSRGYGAGSASGQQSRDCGVGIAVQVPAADGDMTHPDVIVVDPPRKGCDGKCLDTMLKMQPERIVYVSCDSATLARDLRILCDGGYEVKKIRAFDQFGNTTHVEVATCLQRVNS